MNNCRGQNEANLKERVKIWIFENLLEYFSSDLPKQAHLSLKELI